MQISNLLDNPTCQSFNFFLSPINVLRRLGSPAVGGVSGECNVIEPVKRIKTGSKDIVIC